MRDAPGDWRLANCRGMEHVRFRRKIYKAYSEDWQHDHCAACFTELRNAMDWTEVP
jgi:hypothetical protein